MLPAPRADPGMRLSRTRLLSWVKRDRHSGYGYPCSSDPWASCFSNMLIPAQCPGHASQLTLPSTGRLPSTVSAADVTRHCSRLHRCRGGGGGACALPLPARSNGSCSFPASRFPARSPCCVRTKLDPRHQPDQPDQAELRHQARGWIASPRRVPPSLGDEGPQSPFDPAIKPVEEFSDVGLAVVVSPAAYDRVENLDHLAQRYRCALSLSCRNPFAIVSADSAS